MDFIFIKDKKALSEDNLLRLKNFTRTIWGEIDSYENEDIIMLFPKRFKNKCFVRNENVLGFISGYARNYTLSHDAKLMDHNLSFFDVVIKQDWPLNENWTGSFAALCYDFNNDNIIFCNDPIGFYPLYYSFENNSIVISSNLILLSKVFKNEIDATGVLQSLTPQKYYNLGRRTILKNVFRLLPGEFVKLNNNNFHSVERKFDTTLFGKSNDDDINKITKDIWKIITEDIEIILKYDTRVNIAQSGGVDSRLVLAAAPDDKKFTCLTIGAHDFYETQLAEKCAKAKKADFKYFPSGDYLFPELEIIKKYIVSTGSTGDNEWTAILESVKIPTDEVLLLGDMCEAIRSITNNPFIVSRSSRIKSYLRNIFFRKGFEFHSATEQNLMQWKKNKINDLSPPVDLLKSFKIPFDAEEIKSDYAGDLELIFELIEKFNLRYMEQYDLLFDWFTSARQTSARQIILMKNKFFPIAPTTSIRILRNTSYIPPEHLLFDKLVNKIYRQKELQKFADIPTTQIPFIKYSSNGALKYLMWYYRAMMDRYYIRRIMKTKNPNLRDRVCKGTNYPLMYQHKHAEKNIKSWYSNKYLNGEKYINLFMKRKSLERKTTFNEDLVVPASLSITLDIIQDNK